jgi:hypothetical protein
MSLLPRTITITCIRRTANSDHLLLTPQPQTRLDVPRPPPLLHVSREARHEVALKHYQTPLFSVSVSSIHARVPFKAPARIWFDPTLDSLVLAGELEVRNVDDMAVPMVYFLPKADCAPVRRVAIGFACLGFYEGVSDEGLFVLLSHVVDRFPACVRLLITMAEGDAALLRGRRGTRLWDGVGGEGGGNANANANVNANPVGNGAEDVSGALQRLWDGWVRGCTVTGSRLRMTEIVLVEEGSEEEAWRGGENLKAHS